MLKQSRKPYRDAALNEPPHKTYIHYSKDDMAFSHTSVWRWVQWMATLMSVFLSCNPKMATDSPDEAFEFSPHQAHKPKYRENLYLARRYWQTENLIS